MAVDKLVKDMMISGISHHSKKESVEPKEISIFIHTKERIETKEGSKLTYSPLYFYAVNGVPKKDENEQVVHFSFKEIMGLRSDYMQRGLITSQFLKSYFKTLEETEDIPASELYIRITTHEEGTDFKELALGVYRGSDKIKDLTLSDLFGDE